MQTGSLVNFSSTGVDLVLYLLDLVSRLKQQDVEDLFMSTLQVGTKFIPLAMRYSKTCVKRPLSKRPQLIFKTDYRLMQVKVLQNAPRGAFCNTLDLHSATICH